jgi:hypothetical protein
MKSKAPKLPQYQPPAPYQQPQYQQPAPYVAPPNPQATVPKVLTPQQVMTNGAQVEGMLPGWLQLGTNPLDPSNLAQYGNNFYQQNIAPGLAEQQAADANNGQQYSSYAGGRLGQMEAQGQLEKYNAGLSYGQQLLNNQIAGRSSYFSGGPTVSTNQNNADVARGLDIANLMTQQANSQNQYNLGSSQFQNNFNMTANQGQNLYNQNYATGINGFNQQNYANQLSQYGMQQDLANTRGQGALGLGMGLAKLAAPAIGSAFGAATSHPSTLGSMGFGGILGRYGTNQVGSFEGGGTGLDIA